MKDSRLRVDEMICELLQDALEQSCEHRTVWMDIDSITWVVLDSQARWARRLVRQRLRYLLSMGVVERRMFDGLPGWKMVDSSAVISN